MTKTRATGRLFAPWSTVNRDSQLDYCRGVDNRRYVGPMIRASEVRVPRS